MLDILNPDEIFTAGDFAARARPLLNAIGVEGALPVIVGGTGFYLRALLDGLFPAPPRDDSLRTRLITRERAQPGSLHRLLRRFDAAAGRAIHPNDVPKIVRALEVYLLTRRPITSWFTERREALTGFRPLKLVLTPPRAALYSTLNRRTERMFAEGLVGEVKRILDMGWSASAKPFESHGYRQAMLILRGEMAPGQAIEEAQRNTRHYAKRQITWFRKDPDAVWLEGFGYDPDIQRAASGLVRLHAGAKQV